MDAPKRKTYMDDNVRKAICLAVEKEPFAKEMGIRLVELNGGHSIVEMVYRPDVMNNIYKRAHGGAIFSLIDEAFETSCQTEGVVSVALNVNVSYTASPEPEDRLRAESREINRTRKTSLYDIRVTNQTGKLIASCQALAYRTGKSVLEALS